MRVRWGKVEEIETRRELYRPGRRLTEQVLELSHRYFQFLRVDSGHRHSIEIP